MTSSGCTGSPPERAAHRATTPAILRKGHGPAVTHSQTNRVAPGVRASRVALRTGVALAFTERGDRSGPAVLLLHAWIESLRSFDRLTPLLQPSLRVLALDQRGHGEADKPAEGYDLESLAGDVVAFLDAMVPTVPRGA